MPKAEPVILRAVVAALPSGTVTFLFTDIEGSTERWELDPLAMRGALAEHDHLLRSTIEAHRAVVFAAGGDGFAAAFCGRVVGSDRGDVHPGSGADAGANRSPYGNGRRTQRQLLRPDVEPSRSHHGGGPRWTGPGLGCDRKPDPRPARHDGSRGASPGRSGAVDAAVAGRRGHVPSVADGDGGHGQSPDAVGQLRRSGPRSSVCCQI